MKLKELIVEKAILPALKGTKRDECIGELLDALAKAGAFKPALRAEFLKAVVKREKKGSTGFGHGMAVPHVKTPEVHRCVAALGLHPAGIDFNALDRQPVHAVFLLLSPEEQPEAHLDAMESLFGTLSQEQFRKFLKQAKTVADVVTLLEEADASPSSR
ncbi:MAG: PTS sugar transporter subunit IIA [Planctomycetes bacterium]|nr:PTS sugar transporter subunit IIA [Planctomycetota bacterium]